MAFLWYVHLTCFCNIQECFHCYGHRRVFLVQQWGKSIRRLLYRQKYFFFFINGQLFYSIFKSYPSLPKSPEFMTLGVSKHGYSTPALKLPSLLLSHSLHNFNETTLSYQIRISHPSFPPNFSALVLHWYHLKSSIYTCCKCFHIYQIYAKRGF